MILSLFALTLQAGAVTETEHDFSEAKVDAPTESSTSVKTTLMRDVDCDGDYEEVPRDSTKQGDCDGRQND